MTMMKKNMALSCLLMLLMIIVVMKVNATTRTYIVHMDNSAMPGSFSSHKHWYRSIIKASSQVASASAEGQMDGGIDDAEDKILYTYENVMHGFSAKLTQAEVSALEEIPGHIATYPDSCSLRSHTTHSFKFMGLNTKWGIWPRSQLGQDVIIGVLDTGVWPESVSLSDKGMSEVPARWKGKCQSGTAFNSSLCNRKLIGARYFNKGFVAQNGILGAGYDYDSARDFDGHGTHISSTAAGHQASGVEYFGYAKGTATGMAPRARVAMYKVLWNYEGLPAGTASDALAGMDEAVGDGVDVISVSLGSEASQPFPYYLDAISVGAFGAMERGIFVSCSAGNRGPARGTITNGAPWMLTVGATTIDRRLVASVTLPGNGSDSDSAVVVRGTSYFVENVWLSGVPLVYGSLSSDARRCIPGSLHAKSVADKIVLCNTLGSGSGSGSYSYADQIYEATRVGAAAVIIVYNDSLFDLRPQDFIMPAVVITLEEGWIVANHAMNINGTSNRVDIKFQITELRSKPAPVVAKFSSRGPNALSPGILKPDVVAPGVDIVAAWVPNVPVREVATGEGYWAPNDWQLESDYNMISGTSMSSPHAAAIAGLVKGVHPGWSPAAIRSALMTTAYTLDNTQAPLSAQGTPGTPLDFGAGHLNANAAADPGLVYDLGVQEYVNFVCSLHYTPRQFLLLTRRNASQYCSTFPPGPDLNYPSLLATFNLNANRTFTFHRVLTNVGDAPSPSVYKAVVKPPPGFRVRISPRLLLFKHKHQKLHFTLTMKPIGHPRVDEGFATHGSLSWVDDNNHVVKSPLVAIFV